MRNTIAIYLILMNCISIMAQTVVEGNVSDAISGKSIAGANVMIKHPDGKLIGFSLSDGEDWFSVKLNKKPTD